MGRSGCRRAYRERRRCIRREVGSRVCDFEASCINGHGWFLGYESHGTCSRLARIRIIY